MPIEYKNETYYSIEEISKRTNTSVESYDDFVLKNNIEVTMVDNVRYIKKGLLKEFFELYHKEIDIKKHTLPAFLLNHNNRCLSALADIYEEKASFPASLSPIQGEFLRTLVLNIAPKHVVEIGCFIGGSSLWIASALEDLNNDGIVSSIDLFEDIFPSPPFTYHYFENPLNFASDKVGQAGLEHRVNFYKGNSIEIGKNYRQLIAREIDLLFIDGDHTTLGCFNDFKLYEPYVKEGGYILLHDIYPEICGWEGPRHLIDNVLQKNENFEVLELKTNPVNYGIALIRKLM